MALSDLFVRLNAPLTNVRWSWGSERADGTIFLRVWSDEMEKVDGKRCVRLINRNAYRDAHDNLGFAERCNHVQRLANGAPCYGILCTAADTKARSRKIVSFDGLTLLKLGGLHVLDGDEWAEIVDRVPVRKVA